VHTSMRLLKSILHNGTQRYRRNIMRYRACTRVWVLCFN